MGGLYRHAAVSLLSGIPCWAGAHFVFECIAVVHECMNIHAWLAGVEYWLKLGFALVMWQRHYSDVVGDFV